MLKKIILNVFITMGFVAPVFGFTSIPQNKAIIRALNKQTGRTKDIEVNVGANTLFEGILIDIKACYTRPEDETPENTSFVQITEANSSFKDELNVDKSGKQVFSGWIFSSSPSLVAMEHPNYDIWLLECKEDIKLTNKPIYNKENQTL